MKKINFQKILLNKNTLIAFLFTAIALCVLTGCESIPPGSPPKGPIVSITTTNSHPLSPKDAINNMTTAIATCPQLYEKQEIPVINLYPTRLSESYEEYEGQLNHLTVRLYRNLFEMDITKFSKYLATNQCDFLLASTFSRIYGDILEEEDDQPVLFTWEVKLLSPKNTSKTVWKQKVTVKIDKNTP